MVLAVSTTAEGQSAPEAGLFRRIAVPEAYHVTEGGHAFGGDLRIGDLDGDGRCDFLVYRSRHSGPSGPAVGGFKPSFLGAFDMDGEMLWSTCGDDLILTGGRPRGTMYAVAEDIVEDYPEVLVGTLAYNLTSTPPKHLRPRDTELQIEHTFTQMPGVGHDTLALLRGLGEANWGFYTQRHQVL